jgi:hypothetical protein
MYSRHIFHYPALVSHFFVVNVDAAAQLATRRHLLSLAVAELLGGFPGGDGGRG